MTERASAQEEWDRKESERLEAAKERANRLGHEGELESRADVIKERQLRLGHIEEEKKSKSKSKSKSEEAKEESKESEA